MTEKSELKRPLSPLLLPSPALSFSSLSFDLDSSVTPDDRSLSSYHNYCPQLGFDIDADSVLADEAVIHAKISHRRWSADNYLAHEDCTFIVDWAHKKMDEIFQSQGYFGYDALKERFGAFGYDQRLYGPVPRRE